MGKQIPGNLTYVRLSENNTLVIDMFRQSTQYTIIWAQLEVKYWGVLKLLKIK
jgi:hypothetical protein